MNRKESNAPSGLINLDGITYSEDDVQTPLTAEHKWTDADGVDVVTIYEKGLPVNRKLYRDDILSMEAFFENNEIVSMMKYDMEGRIETKHGVFQGKIHGVFELYSEGVLLQTIEHKNGRKDGLSKFYNPDGSISATEFYINDIKQ